MQMSFGHGDPGPGNWPGSVPVTNSVLAHESDFRVSRPPERLEAGLRLCRAGAGRRCPEPAPLPVTRIPLVRPQSRVLALARHSRVTV